jgi:hypothetical protein
VPLVWWNTCQVCQWQWNICQDWVTQWNTSPKWQRHSEIFVRSSGDRLKYVSGVTVTVKFLTCDSDTEKLLSGVTVTVKYLSRVAVTQRNSWQWQWHACQQWWRYSETRVKSGSDSEMLLMTVPHTLCILTSTLATMWNARFVSVSEPISII